MLLRDRGTPALFGTGRRGFAVGRIWAGCLVALGLALAAPASASAVLDRSVEEMAARSHAVVRGTVVRSEARWDASGRRIQTYTQVRVTESLKGGLSGVVVVRQPGGRVGDLEQLASGAAAFSPGEDVVLFLERAPDERGAWLVGGLSSGKVALERGPAGQVHARRSLSGLELHTPAATGSTVRIVDRDDLGEAAAFLERVRAAVRAGGAR